MRTARVELVHQARSELRNERNDGIEPLLQCFSGNEAVQRSRIPDRLFIPRHDLRRRLARDLAHLIFDLAAAGLERAFESDVEMA